uniref:DNA polymerase epsilon catalytic subunit A C-terminal domain-containing protein n=1 Tax=Tanacetum cinerariifolium TaxID=118510 RepID=A0A6L2NW63_TANCI|nr:hypothetical protein [Tanacetum cinerariifolium]
MRVLCPNLDREDALETVLDVPIPEKFTSMGSGVALRWQNMATWMKAQTLEKWSSPVIASRYNELNFLRYMVGSPLLPLQIQPETCSASSIRNSSIEASTAKYIVQQYMAAIGGLQALNSVENLCAIGQVKISPSEFHQGDESVKARNKEETGGFVLWQKHPNLWSLELLVSGCKVISGSNGKISWRQSSNQLRPMTKGPPRPLRWFLQGLDPRSTGDLFLQAAQANPKYEIIHHTIWGYFSQRSGLLVKFEDSRLLTVNGDNGDGIFWETGTESVIEDYSEYDSCYGMLQLELQLADETNHLNPPHRFVPWVLVNNHALQEDYGDLLHISAKPTRDKTNWKLMSNMYLRVETNSFKGNSSYQVDQPIHAFEGAYRRVTVELKIHNLAVNALLKSDQINEMEESGVFGLDEAMSCSPTFHDHFDSIVSDFIYLPSKFAQDQPNERTNTRDDDDDSCTPSVTAAAGEIFQSCMTEYLRDQIKSHFTDKLFGIVTDLQKRGNGKSDALELIKHMCVVFELDNNLTYEIQVKYMFQVLF